MNFEKISCFKNSKMPLSEFYRSINGKNESSQQKSNDIPYIPNDEFVELIWEKGQIMMQGQSSKAKKTPVSNNFQFQTPKVHEKDGILDVSMQEIGLNQDDDMVPWLNYPIDDYCSDLLPEISGVTVHEPNNNMHKNNLSMHDGIGFDQSNTSKVPRNSHLFSWSLDQVHNSDPTVRSGVSDIGSINHRSKPRNIIHKDSIQIQGTTQNLEKKVQKQDSLLNFSHFSRPAAIAKTHLKNREQQQQQIGFVGQSGLDSVKVGSNPFASKPVDEPQCVEKSTPGQEKSTNVVVDGKVSPETVKSNEPVGASSSACSGNIGERASNDLSKSCKRKSRDTEDFECQSQDVEEESLGTKNASGSRSGSGSKRSRAAEVHNLSERRRRDRINEKMRALQELIPNCNKVDKASMLDEAIEYLKTLQLQVQIMSMGSGLCMPPMMFPNGMQHMHPHFSPMGMGMGMGMSYGMGMGMGMGMEMNGMFPYPPTTQGLRQPPPMYGNHTQGMPMLFPQQGIPSVRQIGPQAQISDVGPTSKGPNVTTQLSNQPLVANKSINQSNLIGKKDEGVEAGCTTAGEKET